VAKKDEPNPYKKSKDPYGPVRKQDPYVTGRRDGYQQGGEVQSGGGSNNTGGGKAKMAQHSMPTVSPWRVAPTWR